MGCVFQSLPNHMSEREWKPPKDKACMGPDCREMMIDRWLDTSLRFRLVCEDTVETRKKREKSVRYSAK